MVDLGTVVTEQFVVDRPVASIEAALEGVQESLQANLFDILVE